MFLDFRHRNAVSRWFIVWIISIMIPVDRVSEDNYYSSPRHPAAEPLWLALPDKHRALRNIRLKCKIWQQQLFETWYTYIGSTRTVIQFELDTEQKQALPLPHNTIQCRAIWGSVFCQRGFLKLTNRGKGCNYLFAVNSRVKSSPEQPQNSSWVEGGYKMLNYK